MRKTIKLLPMLLLAWLLFSCDTEVAEFDSIKDAIETAEQEEKEVVEEPKEKTLSERQKDPDTLTFDNNEEYKRVMTTSLSDDEYIKFFNNNQFNIAEFDGAIDLIELKDGKKTRYSMILRCGDYDPNSITGPGFIVKDVGFTESSVKDLFSSGLGQVGQQVKVVAKIYGYDEGSGLIELKLQSLTAR